MEIFLSREINNKDGYVDEIVSAIKSAPDDEELTMLITCIGGDTDQGERIHRAILEHPNQTKAIGIGIAASMGASLFSAFDTVELDPDMDIMLHKARITDSKGNFLKEYTPEQENRIDRFNQRIYERFIKKGVDKDFLYQVFMSDSNENHWLSAQEAENKGIGVVVPVERRNGEPLIEEMENAYKLAAKLDISQIKENFNQKNMGLFKTNKEVPRVHALADERQVIVNSAKEEIQVGDTLTLVGSDESLEGKIKLVNNIEATVDAENKVTNLEEVAAEVSDDEKAEIMTRLEDLEKMVKEMMASKGDEEEGLEDKEKEEMEARKELQDNLQAVQNLGEEVLKAAALISTTAKLDKPENKDRKEIPNLSAAEQHVVALHQARKIKEE